MPRTRESFNGKYGDPGRQRPAPSQRNLFPPPTRLPVGLSAWLFFVAAWLAWAPFRWRSGEPGYQFDLIFDAELLTHFALLVPLAVVLAASGNLRARRTLVGAAATTTVLAFILEAGQYAIDARSISPYDFLAGCIGGLVSVAVTRLVIRLGASPRAIVWGLGVGLFLTVAIAVHFSTKRQNEGLVLENWNPRFSVVQGDEWGGRREYDGQVSDGLVCAGQASERVCLAPGADLTERRRLVEVAERTQNLSLSAQIRSESSRQKGPARIITFSHGPYGRNATLAQTGENLILRLRTPRGGPNGIQYQFSLRHAVPADTPLRVEAEFDRGTVRLSADQGDSVRRGSFAAPFHGTLFANGGSRFRAPLVFHGRPLLVGMLTFFAGLGLLLGLRFGDRPGRLAVAVPVVSLGLLWLLTGTVWNAPLPGLYEHLLVGLVTAAGAAGGAWDNRRLSQAPEPSA